MLPLPQRASISIKDLNDQEPRRYVAMVQGVGVPGHFLYVDNAVFSPEGVALFRDNQIVARYTPHVEIGLLETGLMEISTREQGAEQSMRDSKAFEEMAQRVDPDTAEAIDVTRAVGRHERQKARERVTGGGRMPGQYA